MLARDRKTFSYPVDLSGGSTDWEPYRLEESEAPIDGPITTLMFRNLPRRFTSENLFHELLQYVDSSDFDFLHVPMDKDGEDNIGYAFVNFLDVTVAEKVRTAVAGSVWRMAETGRRAKVAPACMQGFLANLRHCSEKIASDADICHFPMVFRGNGRVSFRVAERFFLHDSKDEEAPRGTADVDKKRAVAVTQRWRAVPRPTAPEPTPAPWLSSDGIAPPPGFDPPATLSAVVSTSPCAPVCPVQDRKWEQMPMVDNRMFGSGNSIQSGYSAASCESMSGVAQDRKWEQMPMVDNRMFGSGTSTRSGYSAASSESTNGVAQDGWQGLPMSARGAKGEVTWVKASVAYQRSSMLVTHQLLHLLNLQAQARAHAEV